MSKDHKIHHPKRAIAIVINNYFTVQLISEILESDVPAAAKAILVAKLVEKIQHSLPPVPPPSPFASAEVESCVCGCKYSAGCPEKAFKKFFGIFK